MKIRRVVRRALFAVTILIAVGSISIVAWRTSNSAEKVSAYEEDDDAGYEGITREHLEGAQDKSGEDIEFYWVDEPVASENGEVLESQYDARVKYPGVRTKNQNSEGLCWLYSSVTALEYNIAKNYEDYEISNKHLDYLTIDGRYVYKQAGATNAYFDRYLSADGAYRRTDLGTSGANQELVYSMMDPMAIVSESDFARVMVNNDARLSGIYRYEDLWNDDIISSQERGEILKKNFEKQSAYMERQNFSDVNDPSKVEYVVTGAKMTSYGFDVTRTKDSEVVDAIKNLVSKYGAVKISTFGTGDRFDNCSDKKIIDGRNRYTFIVDNRVVRVNPDDPESEILYECTANHGMTIVGWDDEWTYEYNNEEKSGAFVLQNSWGESSEDNMKWHLAYISAVPGMMYFDSVERYDDYDRYYGVRDYKEQTISPASDEHVFEFSLGNNEEIEAFVFSELYGSYEYDVYVSNTGSASDFKKDGSFTSRSGITKYKFNRKYEITGDFAVKIKRANGSKISDNDKARGTMNVLSDKVWALRIFGNEGDNVRMTCRLKNGSCSVILPSSVKPGYRLIGYADSANATAPIYHTDDTIVLNGDKTIYAIWAVDYGYIEENYNIIMEGNSKYMDLTEFRKDMGEFDKIFSDNGVDIYTVQVESKKLDKDLVLYTGGKTRIYKNNNLKSTYTNVIRGDTNGDGDINVKDYIRIKKDIMSQIELQGEYKLAGDMNKNNRIDIQDYIGIKKLIMGKV